MTSSQTGRVLEQLRRGPVTPVDFMAPAADGGPPIMRLGARIYDLRRAGHVIESQNVPAPGGTAFVAEYTLVQEASVSVLPHNPPATRNADDDQAPPPVGAGTPKTPASSSAPTQDGLFTVDVPKANHFDREAA